MHRIHDLGGVHGFGEVDIEPEDAPVFEHLWEARVFALMRVLMGGELWTLDEVRHTIERMAPAAYLDAEYYERWLVALETLLVERAVLDHDELAG